MKIAYVTQPEVWAGDASAVNRRRLWNLIEHWQVQGIQLLPWSPNLACDAIYVPNLLGTFDAAAYAAASRRRGQALILGMIEDFDCGRWASAANEEIDDLPALIAADRRREASLRGRLKAVREKLAEAGFIRSRRACIVGLLRSADALVCTSEAQAAGLRKYNPNVHGIADPISESEYSAHDPNFTASLLEKARSANQIVLAWEGTAWGLQLLELIRPAINHIAALRPGRLRLRLIAPSHRPDRFYGDTDNERLLSSRYNCSTERFDWDLATAGDLLRTADIGLAPMPTTNPFYLAKAYSKPLVYMTLGLPVVASSVPSYRELIEHEASGFIAERHEDWSDLLMRLIDDPALRKATGLRAMARAAAFHPPERAAARFAAAFRSAVAVAKAAQ